LVSGSAQGFHDMKCGIELARGVGHGFV
jgi:hypothetical protein